MKITIDEKIGNDNGNSEQDIIINGSIISQANVFAKVNVLPLLDDLKVEYVVENLEDKLIVTVNSPSALPGIYYVGNYALVSGKRLHNMEVGALNDKATSDVVVINTLAQIAAYAVKQAYKENPNLDVQIEAKVDMTTALPVTQYNKASSEKLRNKFMNKKHNVIVHVGTLRADVDISFEFVKVLPESVPVIFALKEARLKDETEDKFTIEIFEEFSHRYKIMDEDNYFENKKTLHIAIGEGTTEFPITNDIIFNPEFITGSDNGVGHAIENALPAFKKAVGLRTFSRQNYSAIIRNVEHKYYSYAAECLEDPLEAECEDILHIAKSEIERANNDIDLICVHGGGSILMKPFLYEKLLKVCEKADIKLFYVPEKYAVTLEARGMYAFTNCDIFKALKAKSIASKED